MKKKTIYSLLACVGLSLIFSACSSDNKKIVAEVNEGGIKAIDYKRTLNNVLRGFKKEDLASANLPNIGEQVLNEMIVREVLLQNAQKNNITTSEEEVNAMVATLKKQFKDEKGQELKEKKAQKAYKKAVKEKGFTEKEYKKYLSENIVIEKFKKAVLVANLKPVTEAEVKKFYNNVSSIYNQDTKAIATLRKTPALFNEANVVAQNLINQIAPTVNVALAVIPLESSATSSRKEAAKKVAQNVKQELKSGKALQDLSDISSNKEFQISTGNLVLRKNTIPTQLVTAAFALNVGEVSDPIEIFDLSNSNAQGIFVVKVIEKTKGTSFSYDAFAKDLESYINIKRGQNTLADVTAVLVKGSKIRVTDAFAPITKKIIKSVK